MELRDLRYFVSVVEALSFTKAAGKLHTAQPSLTRQIKDLEEVRFLNRPKQQVSLTDEGRSFLIDRGRGRHWRILKATHLCLCRGGLDAQQTLKKQQQAKPNKTKETKS